MAKFTNIEEIIERMKKIANVRTDTELSKILGLKAPSVISGAKKTGNCFPMSIHWATEYFTDLTTKIGMPDVGLHTLRHTFASHLAMSGVPLFHIAQWLGHSTTHVTELYAHLCQNNPGRTEIERLSF